MSNRERDHQENQKPGADNLPEWLRLVAQQVASLQYGTVEITVHDSEVVQVEKSEKVRLDRKRERH